MVNHMSQQTYTIKDISIAGDNVNISFEQTGAALSIPKADAGNLKAGDVVTVNFGEKKVQPADAGNTAQPRRTD